MRLWKLVTAAAVTDIGVSIARPLPNFVVLFADNLGAFDVGKSTTPNIASLASDGVNLTNWNSAAHLCSASRAALLTGKYPVRSGIYPGVFKPDAANGLSPNETTLAEVLKGLGYSTRIIGKWHLGHREDFLPTEQGFDEWLGIPFPMSGGSLDNHTCAFDSQETMWLPLYKNKRIVQQPVILQNLANIYADHARSFIHTNSRLMKPFFLYMAFSHVHQLCAPKDYPEQEACQWAGKHPHALEQEETFHSAVAEMDWITGRILSALEENEVTNSTFVLFTSDNGPWVAEQTCSGQKGPYRGQW
jgi:arylsulfatase